MQSTPVSGRGTSILSGLSACFDVLHGAGGNRAIVVATDGQDNGAALMLRPSYIVTGVSIVTVGIGCSMNEDNLHSLASQPAFFIPSAASELFAKAVRVANASCKVVTVDQVNHGTPSPSMSPSPPPPVITFCQREYAAYDFQSASSATVPTYVLRARSDIAFTRRIVAGAAPAIAILNANGITAEFILADGSAIPSPALRIYPSSRPISSFSRLRARLWAPALAMKPFPITRSRRPTIAAPACFSRSTKRSL